MKKVLVLSMICLFCLSGCCTQFLPSCGGTGSLLLKFSNSELEAGTVVPSVNMNVTSYNVSGSGPNGASFLQSGVTAAFFARNSLEAGAWSIIVDAINADSELIGTGSTAVSIQGGETAEAMVAVAPLSGSGSLSVNITWPSGAISNPVVSSTLTPIGGSAHRVPFSLGAAYASCLFSSLNVGYYSMTIQLADGETLKWGCFEAVRILKDAATTAAFGLTMRDISTGSANITINPVLRNPIEITLSVQQEHLAPGTDMTVTASTSVPVDSYQWYLNGGRLPGATGPSVTLGSSLGIGNYRLDVSVSKSQTLG